MVFHEPDSLTPSSLPSGDVGSAVELLEEVYTRPGSTSPSMSFVFRKVLEEGKEEAVDKCKTHTHSYVCEDFTSTRCFSWSRWSSEENKHQKPSCWWMAK